MEVQLSLVSSSVSCPDFPSSSGVNNSVLTVDTTYSTLSSQPSASSPIESLQSLSSPVASISVSNGQSTSSSPRPSLTGLSGQNSQNDVPVSQGTYVSLCTRKLSHIIRCIDSGLMCMYVSSSTLGVFPSSGMTVLSSVHQPMVPSPAGLSGSPEPVSAPLSVMTTLSGPFSSAPQSMVGVGWGGCTYVHTYVRMFAHLYAFLHICMFACVSGLCTCVRTSSVFDITKLYMFGITMSSCT